MVWKNTAVLALAMLAVGCSSSSKQELPPAELPKFEAEVRLQSQWSRSIGDGQGDLYTQLSPASDGQNLYVASADGEVHAVDRLTGKALWDVDLDLPISGGVGADYGLVLVGTLKGDVVALDATNGEEKWRAKVTSEVLSAPAYNGTTVVVQTQDDRLIGLDGETGAQRWIYENTPAVLTLRGSSNPVINSRMVIAGLSSGKVIALDANRGFPIWEQRVAFPTGRSELERVVDIDGNLLLSNGKLYVVTYQGKMSVFDAETGQPLWNRDASSHAGLAQGFGNVYISQAAGSVESIDERSTTALWHNEQLQRRHLSAPEVFSSYVAVGDYEGYLHLLSQVDGRFVGREKIDSAGLRARPLVVGDWIYVYGNSGKLVGLTIR